MCQCDHRTLQSVWTVVVHLSHQGHAGRAVAVCLDASVAQIVLADFTGKGGEKEREIMSQEGNYNSY